MFHRQLGFPSDSRLLVLHVSWFLLLSKVGLGMVVKWEQLICRWGRASFNSWRVPFGTVPKTCSVFSVGISRSSSKFQALCHSTDWVIGVGGSSVGKIPESSHFSAWQDSNPHLPSLLLWQVDALPLSHLGNPGFSPSWDANSTTPYIKNTL